MMRRHIRGLPSESTVAGALFWRKSYWFANVELNVPVKPQIIFQF
jgi:hypothetical protein